MSAPTQSAITGDEVADRLGELGFERRSVSSDGRRVLFELGELRLVVPVDGRALPMRMVRMLESAIAPVFGPGRLTTAAGPGAGTDDRVEAVVVLDAVVLADDDGWYAYLLEEPAIVGFGTERIDALRDLKEAAALRAGTSPGHIALFTPTVV